MKYLLVLGFACDVYRREPRARITVNNQLIDEFHVKHQPEKKEFTHYNEKYNLEIKHPLAPWSNKKRHEYFINSLPSLHFYNLDFDLNDHLNQTDITIDIDNNDTNYVNGFMNKFTSIKCKILSLLPADKKIYFWFAEQIYKRRYKKYAFFHKSNTNINDLFDLKSDVRWVGNNGQQFVIDINNNFFIGGSGKFHCKLIKKYGILLPKTKNSYSSLNRVLFAEFLYNKYEQHAN